MIPWCERFLFQFESDGLMQNNLANTFAELPLVAILRGIQNDECEAIATVLYDAGFRCIEVPLNSPNALRSIEILVKHLPADCLIGAGTVMTVTQVQAVQATGAGLIVMPHCDTVVIREAKALDMACAPGVATLTEAFAALAHGADALKLFPAESVAPTVLKAWRTVLPADAICLPVGGVKADSLFAYVEAGANGFGLGSHLYKAGQNRLQVGDSADAYARAWRAIAAAK